MAKSRNRGSSNRNDWGVVEMARERPLAAAAAAAGAAAAGLFLWSRRSQISNQISELSDQMSEWSQHMGEGGGPWSGSDDTAGLTTSGTSGTSGSRRGQRGMSETGGGNASLGATSGGAGTTGSASGRGRGRRTPTT